MSTSNFSWNCLVIWFDDFFYRFKEYLRKRPVARPPPISMIPTVQDVRQTNEVEYYNDLPGKTPPEFSPVQKSRLHKGMYENT